VADQLGAGIRQYLADLGHADLGFTIRHGMRGRIGRRQQLGLALQLLGDPEALEQTLEIDSSRTLLDITNRLGIVQRALESLGGADVRLRCAPLDCEARARACNVGARRSHELALFDEVLGDGRAEDGDIERNALLDLGLERDRRVERE